MATIYMGWICQKNFRSSTMVTKIEVTYFGHILGEWGVESQGVKFKD